MNMAILPTGKESYTTGKSLSVPDAAIRIPDGLLLFHAQDVTNYAFIADIA